MINDIFIANKSELKQITEEVSLILDLFPGIDAKGIDPVKIATLYSLLSGLSFEDALDEQILIKAITENEGPWISVIPNGLRDSLVPLTDESVKDVANHWAETEEFQLNNWRREDVHKILLSITHLARQALTENKSMFLWSGL